MHSEGSAVLLPALHLICPAGGILFEQAAGMKRERPYAHALPLPDAFSFLLCALGIMLLSVLPGVKVTILRPIPPRQYWKKQLSRNTGKVRRCIWQRQRMSVGTLPLHTSRLLIRRSQQARMQQAPPKILGLLSARTGVYIFSGDCFAQRAQRGSWHTWWTDDPLMRRRYSGSPMHCA